MECEKSSWHPVDKTRLKLVVGIAGTINQHGKITISLGTGNVATLKGDLDETGWMKQVQIPQELFVQLIHYHLMEDDSHVDEIKIGLEKKLDAMVLRELYGKSKTAPTEDEREKARQEYLERRGIPDSFRW